MFGCYNDSERSVNGFFPRLIVKKRGLTRWISLAIIVQGLFGMMSCSQIGEAPGAFTGETKVVKQITQSDAEFHHLFLMAEKVLIGQDSTHAFECTSVTYGSEGSFIWSFDSKCIRLDGKIRSGQLEVRFQGESGEKKRELNIRMLDYMVDNVTFFGEIKFQDLLWEQEELIGYTLLMEDVSVTDEKNSQILLSAEKKYTWEKKNINKTYKSDFLEIEGHSFGVYEKRENFSIQSLGAVRLSSECMEYNGFSFASGILQVKLSDMEGEMVLDFGNGDCDRVATISYDLWEKEILL